LAYELRGSLVMKKAAALKDSPYKLGDDGIIF
jgi:hypothetical protein